MLAAITRNVLQGQSFVQNIKYGFATKMQAGSTQKTKDSAGRRLGVKKFGNEEVFPNDILVRQRGFRWKPGNNTAVGVDHTIHSKIEGVVYFERMKQKLNKVFKVHVIPRENPNRTHHPPPPYCYHPELFPELAAKNPPQTNYPNKFIKPQNEKPEQKTYFKLASQVYGQIQIPSFQKQEQSEQLQ